MGDSLTYECVTLNSNPPALIQWFVDNATVPQGDQHTRTAVSPDGGWTTHSNITVEVDGSSGNIGALNKIVTCNAINRSGH